MAEQAATVTLAAAIAAKCRTHLGRWAHLDRRVGDHGPAGAGRADRAILVMMAEQPAAAVVLVMQTEAAASTAALAAAIAAGVAVEAAHAITLAAAFAHAVAAELADAAGSKPVAPWMQPR